jgi:hypothetical protein
MPAKALLERVVGGLHEAGRLVLGRGLRLADHERARVVDDEGVGHRPPGVDRQHARFALAHPHPSEPITAPAA